MNQQNNEISFHVFNAALPAGKMVAVMASSDNKIFHVMSLESAENLIDDLKAICGKIRRGESE